MACSCVEFVTLLYAIHMLNVAGFNIDISIPVIKKGPDDSYFGFSVAQHQQIYNGKKVTENILLVGAPKLDLQSSNENFTGGVFKCNASSPRKDDCQLLHQNESGTNATLDKGWNDQWLGVSVRSGGAGKAVVACAHRYTDKNYGLGACHGLSQDLIFSQDYSPCKGLSMIREHNEFGFCQAGMSLFITEDEKLVIGAPGPIDWVGMLAEIDISSRMSIKKWFRSPTDEHKPVNLHSYLGYSVVAGKFDNTNLTYYVAGAPHSLDNGQVVFFTEMSRGATLKYGVTQILMGDLPFSGFGMELIAVDVNNDSYEDLIVSCPYYYVKEKDKIHVEGAVYVYIGQGDMITNYTKPQIIKGRSLSQQDCDKLHCLHARFGFSLSKTGDLNNDGYQDFAVGAPFEGNGAVYIYHGSKDGIKEPYSQRIYAEDVIPSGWNTFGYSLSGGMDLDNNSYPDLLVGSYADNKVALLRTRPIIKLHTNVTVFPDKLNMSSENQKLCPLDERKVYCLNITLCLGYTAHLVERFSSPIDIIYTVIAEPDRINPRVEFLKNKTVVTKVRNKFQLLSQGTSGVAPYAANAKFACVSETAYVKDLITDVLTAIEFGISFHLPEKAIPTSTPNPETLLDINEYPVLDSGLSPTDALTIIKVDFVKKCGEDQICKSDLQMKAELLGLKINERNQTVLEIGSVDILMLKVDIENKGETAYQTTFYLLKPSALTWQQSDPKDIGCSPVDMTMVECKDIGSKKLGKPLEQGSVTKFILYFQIDNTALATVRTLQLQYWVNTTSDEQTPKDDYSTISILVYMAADIQVTGRSEPDSSIPYSGSVRGESDMKIEHMIGPSINHTFTILNNGPAVVNTSEFTIYWPYELASKYSQGKHLLYLMQSPQVLSGDVNCFSQPEIVNVLKVQEDHFLDRQQPRPYRAASGIGPNYNIDSGPHDQRERREMKTNESSPSEIKDVEPITSATREKKRVILLDCVTKTANCHVIHCKIGVLQKNSYVKIRLRARLWESTLLEDYRNVDEVQIRSTGKVHIRPELNVEQNNTDNDIGHATTVAIPSIQTVVNKYIAWWIYFLAVLGGIVLFFVIALCLWKMGCFKRKHPEDISPCTVKVEKKKNTDIPSAFNIKIEFTKDYKDDSEVESFLKDE